VSVVSPRHGTANPPRRVGTYTVVKKGTRRQRPPRSPPPTATNNQKPKTVVARQQTAAGTNSSGWGLIGPAPALASRSSSSADVEIPEFGGHPIAAGGRHRKDHPSNRDDGGEFLGSRLPMSAVPGTNPGNRFLRSEMLNFFDEGSGSPG